MRNWLPAMKRFLAAATVAASATAAFGYALIDPDIKIIKNDNSPTLAVKYTGAKAARLELKINGTIVSTKELNNNKASGLVPFTIALDKLQQGDNLLEVTLYDAAGEVIGSERSTMVAQKGENQPVFVKLPKMGQTVRGTVEIKVGFGIDMRETYVSFFVDKQFRAMRNYPPYNYMWDTTIEPNGWHELQAWSFDQSQQTRKSQSVRVYVDNPGGRTDRIKPGGEGQIISANPAPPVSSAKGMKGAKPSDVSGATTSSTPAAAPILSGAKATAPIGQYSGLKSPTGVFVEVSGFRVTTPKTVRAAVKSPVVKSPVVLKAIPKTTSKAVTPKTKSPGAIVKIVAGTKIARKGTFGISFEGRQIQFDVSPRITDGVPLTPFRHLLEGAGGKVDWQDKEKVCTGTGLGYEVWIKIGDLFAKANGKSYQLDYVPFLEKGRTIVPLSFINTALALNVDYDPRTNHVLITKK